MKHRGLDENNKAMSVATGSGSLPLLADLAALRDRSNSVLALTEVGRGDHAGDKDIAKGGGEEAVSSKMKENDAKGAAIRAECGLEAGSKGDKDDNEATAAAGLAKDKDKEEGKDASSLGETNKTDNDEKAVAAGTHDDEDDQGDGGDVVGNGGKANENDAAGAQDDEDDDQGEGEDKAGRGEKKEKSPQKKSNAKTAAGKSGPSSKKLPKGWLDVDIDGATIDSSDELIGNGNMVTGATASMIYSYIFRSAGEGKRFNLKRLVGLAWKELKVQDKGKWSESSKVKAGTGLVEYEYKNGTCGKDYNTTEALVAAIIEDVRKDEEFLKSFYKTKDHMGKGEIFSGNNGEIQMILDQVVAGLTRKEVSIELNLPKKDSYWAKPERESASKKKAQVQSNPKTNAPAKPAAAKSSAGSEVRKIPKNAHKKRKTGDTNAGKGARKKNKGTGKDSNRRKALARLSKGLQEMSAGLQQLLESEVFP